MKPLRSMSQHPQIRMPSWLMESCLFGRRKPRPKRCGDTFKSGTRILEQTFLIGLVTPLLRLTNFGLWRIAHPIILLGRMRHIRLDPWGAMRRILQGQSVHSLFLLCFPQAQRCILLTRTSSRTRPPRPRRTGTPSRTATIQPRWPSTSNG